MVRIAIVSVALLSLGALVTSAHADEGAQHAKAQTLVEAGLKDARAKRFKAAAENFDAAFKLYPHADIAHNLGRAQEELGQLVAAIDAFKRALDMNASYKYAEEARTRITALDKALRETHGLVTVRSSPVQVVVTLYAGERLLAGHLTTPVTRYIPAGAFSIKASKAGSLDTQHDGEVAAGVDIVVDLELRPVPKKGFVTVTSDAEGAEVFIDGQRVGVTPLEGHAVTAGRHALLVKAMGRMSFEASFEVAPNAEEHVGAVLSLALIDEPPADLSLIGGILLGSAGGVAVVATTLWVFAFEKADEARIASDRGDPVVWKEASSTADMLEAGAWVSAAAALGLIAAGTTLLFMGGDDDDTADAARWTPLVTPTKGGLGVGAMVRF